MMRVRNRIDGSVLRRLAPVLLLLTGSVCRAQQVDFGIIGEEYQSQIQPLLRRYCLDCHNAEDNQGELDLLRFASLNDVRREPKVWLKVAAMIDNGEMPPTESPQPSERQRKRLRSWVQSYLDAEAISSAGDPGPVILRRLSNSEYNYTIRDLTGIDTLDPTREFPVDGAAGEGFTNSGSAQSMSPSLVQKYLDAAKEVAQHAILLPDGIEFSRYTSRRDQTDEIMAGIQAFYRQFTADGGGQPVNLQGIQFDTNQGGVFPLQRYFAATLAERDELESGRKTIAEVAAERSINAKYLGMLWQALKADDASPFFVMNQTRRRWQEAKPEDAGTLIAFVTELQKALWKYNTVGQITDEGKPGTWLEPVIPTVSQHSIKMSLPPSQGEDVSLFLVTSDAGDQSQHDYAVWENPRLTILGGPDIPLRDLAGLQERLDEIRKETLEKTAEYLAAARHVSVSESKVDNPTLEELVEQRGLDLAVLRLWLDYLAISDPAPVVVSGHFEKTEIHGNYNFVQSWGTGATPVIGANSSDQQVRIPGISRPHSIQAHPSPTLFVAAGWQSPIDGVVQVDAKISDAHPECGNGQQWWVQHRTSRKVGNLWTGEFEQGGSREMSPTTISVRKGDLVSMVLGPRAGSHACDLTEISLSITQADDQKLKWDLADDVSDDILAGNPHDDSYGNTGVWHFYRGPVDSIDRRDNASVAVPAGSVLARWQTEPNEQKQEELARQIQKLVTGDAPDSKSSDGVLYEQVRNLATAPHHLDTLLADVQRDPRFGKHPMAGDANPDHLIVRAPSVIEFRIPAKLAAERTLVANCRLDRQHGREGSVRMDVTTSPVGTDAIAVSVPTLVEDGTETRQRVQEAYQQFHRLFPPALCYARIVPVDEVVTSTLYYRQDDHLQRLMLSEQQAGELNRLWEELFFVAQEPLKYQVAFEQLRAFATQDRPDLVKKFAPHTKAVDERAREFKQSLIETEPIHLDAVVKFADRAWRRELTSREQDSIRTFYQLLRKNELPHEESIRLTLARVLTSPAFLYRKENAASGESPGPVSSAELATRLSYFLWSSLPDAELRSVADAGKLTDEKVLLRQAERMLRHPKTRRLAVQFACQWLHLRDFDRNDDKNEKLYPEFATLRGDMYEETVRFFEDMFRGDGSILGILDANHTFLSENLANHYSIPWKLGAEADTPADWQRFDGVQSKGRGGVLAMASFLASQSGASRTSPILRGNWVYETLLGQRLPRPPADVPVLADERPDGLTARQLIEQHSSQPGCAKCHVRIDPYGFALEQYDAIGRMRGESVDTTTQLSSGQSIAGIDGLRGYLVTERRDDFVRQFCRKLLGYSLGREVQLSDRPLIERMMKELSENDYRFSVAVNRIILSDQFRKIRGR